MTSPWQSSAREVVDIAVVIAQLLCLTAAAPRGTNRLCECRAPGLTALRGVHGLFQRVVRRNRDRVILHSAPTRGSGAVTVLDPTGRPREERWCRADVAAEACPIRAG